MSLTNDQIDRLISQIEAGASLKDLVDEYQDAEVVEIYECISFLKSQRLSVKPNPAGLKSALAQSVIWDDEPAPSTWDKWFRSWRWAMGGTLSFALMVILFLPSQESESLVVSPLVAPVIEPQSRLMVSDQIEPELVQVSSEGVVASSNDEMSLILNQLEADFESDFAEYQNLKEGLMPMAGEEVFSAQLYPLNSVF